MAVLQKLLNDLRSLGVQSGDLLLVHSSLNGLKRGYQNPDEVTPQNVIDTLLQAVGKTGTLMMPALSYSFVTGENNLFDVQSTPSCVGIIPETFRLNYPVFRSFHPTHSVSAYGEMALELTKDHILDRSPLGVHSPFRKMKDCGGKILMLGCGLKTMTYMHGVEELLGVDYCIAPDLQLYRLRDQNGVEMQDYYRHHDFAGYAQRYDRLAAVMGSDIAKGKTLGGESYLLSSEKLEKAAIAALEKDPHYFVDRME